MVKQIELKKVLVADDSPNIRSLLIEVVTAEVTNGINVDFIEADNGAEALKLYKQEGPFDLVLSDGQMSEMDGIELAKAIFEENVNQPLVIISGHVTTLEKAAAANICHIRKPYKIPNLMAEIIKALGA
ncbi:MAG: response regulator [bacterium]|nr:response regulator [bacterium]